jgi:Bacterial tandem repeat domain 1
LTAQQHQQRFEDWSAAGFRARNIAVTSVDGQPRYTALYDKSDGGSWMAKSRLTPDEYQQAFADNSAQGRKPVYLNAYGLDGKIYFSAIFASKPGGALKARHGLTSQQYQTEWESTTGAGYLTRVVTGYSTGENARYAAIWRK